ncbi:MAG: hypothetical protein KBC53_00175 [Nitrosomonas sp.]|nr:hypothetical protein [Nitrosomonas sp.]
MIINGTDYDHLCAVAKQRIREAVEGGVRGAHSMIAEESNLLIVSDGLAKNTRIYCNGVILNNVTSIEIGKIVCGEYLTARIEVLLPRLHMRANLK